MESIVASRLAVLSELGIDTASALPVIPACDPMLAAPPGRRIVHGCPEVPTIIVLFDTVQAGPGRAPWTLRRFPIIYHPDVGLEANVTDVVVGLRNGEYVVLEKKLHVLYH